MYTDDHEPAHVHVIKAGQEVVIDLGSQESRPSIRENKGMSKKDERRALVITGDYQVYLLEKWEEYHG
jgi:hypothetical protein